MILNPRKYKDFNELFAEFLGCTKDEEDNWKFPDGSKMTKTMHFHDRWDWLMMVVEKIIWNNTGTFNFNNQHCDLHVYVTTLNDYVDLGSSKEKTLLLNLYNVCYQYIKNIKNE